MLNVGNPVPPESDTVSTNSTVAPLTAALLDNYRANNAGNGASATLIANYGQLSVQANGTASKTGANATSGPGAFQSTASGNPVARYTDSITVTSTTLANGAPATFRFTLVVTSTITQDGIATASVSGDLLGTAAGSNNLRLTVNATTQTISTNIVLHVGDSINLTGDLYAAGSVNVGSLHPGQSDAWAISGPQGYANVATYIDPLTTGATYTSSSGKAYPVLGSTVAPQLTLQRSGINTITISWPSASTGYQLQQSSTLNKNSWATFTGTINDNGTAKSVQIPLSSGNLFFRLKQ